jgi:hypothetical protein
MFLDLLILSYSNWASVICSRRITECLLFFLCGISFTVGIKDHYGCCGFVHLLLSE